MTIAEAQEEIRTTYLGGFFGQLISGAMWLAAAGLGSWASPQRAIAFLVIGGMFIFPLVQLALKVSGRPASVSDRNPMRHLAMQIAFTIPLTLPLVFAATLYRREWFFPAMLISVGSHYLPFVFLYGMRMFALLAGVMIATGVLLGTSLPASFSAGGWIGGATLLVFAVIGRRLADPRAALAPAATAARS